LRLFFVLAPHPDVMAAITPLMGGIAGARWQSLEQLHVTLRFVGDVPANLADELGFGLNRMRFDVHVCTLDATGCFRTSGRPNALWVGMKPVAPLATLHRKVDRLCQNHGLPPEGRAYFPHMTLARLPGTALGVDEWLRQWPSLAPRPVRFTHVSLMESRLGQGGSHYAALASVPLG